MFHIRDTIQLPNPTSHKGQNGRLLIIGGSALFHSASMWSLTVASRIVDLVHYSSIPENNKLIQKAKEEFRNCIVVGREDIDAYIQEDDCILIGPGMTRSEETASLTNILVSSYPKKRWVIDAGALQMIDPHRIPHGSILTPHHKEFAYLQEKTTDGITPELFAKQYQCIIVQKGTVDIVTNGEVTEHISGGNAGMTKGGTGDVLSGLIAALATTNAPFAAACAGSYINKQAGDDLYVRVGPFYNATDLANQIPLTMRRLLVP